MYNNKGNVTGIILSMYRGKTEKKESGEKEGKGVGDKERVTTSDNNSLISAGGWRRRATEEKKKEGGGRKGGRGKRRRGKSEGGNR